MVQCEDKTDRGIRIPQREVVVLYQPQIANLVSNINVPVEVREKERESGRKRGISARLCIPCATLHRQLCFHCPKNYAKPKYGNKTMAKEMSKLEKAQICFLHSDEVFQAHRY